ncbi:MAG TPA: PilZ domain-containing protein, partial [Polyangiaceae bacterium]|nr:PilZ domain-containing protein [Polyangiaceae bacterium]
MRSTVLGNRRKALRYAVRIPCQVVRERDFRLISDAVLDVSVSGMVVTAAHWVFGQSILTGDRLIVSFQLPNGHFWVDAEATVTRVARGRRRGENAPALALEFDPLPLFVRQRMRGSLRRSPPPPPQPRPGRRRNHLTAEP